MPPKPNPNPPSIAMWLNKVRSINALEDLVLTAQNRSEQYTKTLICCAAVLWRIVPPSVVRKNGDMFHFPALQCISHQCCSMNGAHRKQKFSLCLNWDLHLSKAEKCRSPDMRTGWIPGMIFILYWHWSSLDLCRSAYFIPDGPLGELTITVVFSANILIATIFPVLCVQLMHTDHGRVPAWHCCHSQNAL